MRGSGKEDTMCRSGKKEVMCYREKRGGRMGISCVKEERDN